MPRLITTNMSINNGDVERRYHDFSSYCQEARPDIVAVQEVSADVGREALGVLARALGHDYQFDYAPVYKGQEDEQGLGIISRVPVKQSTIVDPGRGRNMFQVLTLSAERNRPLLLANVHLEAHLLLDYMRRRKLRSLTSQLDRAVPQVIAGDFNAIPRFPSIRSIKKTHRSAYWLVYGSEPAYTYPTDLGEHLLLNNGDATRQQIFWMKLGARVCQAAENRRPRGLPRLVADYVFINQLVEVKGVSLTGHDEIDKAHSDHRGLQVDFALS